MTIPSDVREEIQKLEPSAIIELFELVFTLEVNGVDATFRYHAGTNEIHGDIVWNANTFSAVPCEVDGFEKTTKGTLPRPTFRIANANSVISSLIILYNPLQARMQRIRTCKKFLDGANFTSGTNAQADPGAVFEQNDYWYIDRISTENAQVVEFELTSKLNLMNLALPRRQVLEHCPWKYKGVECGYRGQQGSFDIHDVPTNTASDKCGHRYSSCVIRFPGRADLPFGGFPGARLQM